MNTVAVPEHLQELRALVERLIGEHRKYASDMEVLNSEVQEGTVEMLREPFTSLQDSLTEHMLVEEFEVYPELMRKNLFDSSVSSIMQQHHDVTSCLGKMELSLRLGNLAEFRSALEGLAVVLRSHHPAEEERVFPLVVN
jgi:iron-sulfur cluster repair protein YtfE (RIC family)